MVRLWKASIELLFNSEEPAELYSYAELERHSVYVGLN